MHCKRCLWTWNYKGSKVYTPKYPQFTKCPRCMKNIKIEGSKEAGKEASKENPISNAEKDLMQTFLNTYAHHKGNNKTHIHKVLTPTQCKILEDKGAIRSHKRGYTLLWK